LSKADRFASNRYISLRLFNSDDDDYDDWVLIPCQLWSRYNEIRRLERQRPCLLSVFHLSPAEINSPSSGHCSLVSRRLRNKTLLSVSRRTSRHQSSFTLVAKRSYRLFQRCFISSYVIVLVRPRQRCGSHTVLGLYRILDFEIRPELNIGYSHIRNSLIFSSQNCSSRGLRPIFVVCLLLNHWMVTSYILISRSSFSWLHIFNQSVTELCFWFLDFLWVLVLELKVLVSVLGLNIWVLTLVWKVIVRPNVKVYRNSSVVCKLWCMDVSEWNVESPNRHFGWSSRDLSNVNASNRIKS